MLGLLNNGVEHFLGVLLFLLLLLLGVVGDCIGGFGDCKEVKGRGGGGGIDAEVCTFGKSEKDGDGGGIKDGGIGGGGGGRGGDKREGENEEGHEENKGTGCEDFDRTSSNISRNFFSSSSNVI